MTTNHSIDALHRRLHVITQAEAHLGPLDLPAIQDARHALKRVRELDDMAAQITDVDPGDVIQTAAHRLIAGKLDATDLLLAAAQIETGNTGQALTIIDTAKEQIGSHALTNLNHIREDWLPLMRPLIERSLAPLAKMRRQLPDRPMYDTDLPHEIAHNLRRMTANYDALFDLTAQLVSPGSDGHNTALQRYLHPERYTGPRFIRGTALSILPAHY